MKKVLMLIMLMVLSMSVAFGCVGDDCFGEEANTPVLDIVDCWVEVDGRYVEPDRTIYKVFDRGEEVDISVELVSQQDADDVQIQALILGYEHGDRARELISDLSPTFDVRANRSYQEDLTLTIPDDLDQGDLKLRIIISDRSYSTFVRDYNLDIEAVKHKVVIEDLITDPTREVMSGEGIFARVRVENMGDRDEDSVKVIFAFPELDIDQVTYIDELDAEDSESSDDVFIRLPDCVETGSYDLEATVEYDDGYESVTETKSIKITMDPACEEEEDEEEEEEDEEKTIITIPGTQDVTVGTTGAIYPIMISNTGKKTKVYTVTISGMSDWGTYRIEPGPVLSVGPKETEAAYLYVTAKDTAAAGQKIFIANIESAGETEQIPLTANIKAKSGTPTGSVISGGITDWSKIRQGLEIGLVVLIVLLVILGLIIGFNKLRGSGGGEEAEEEISGQTYY